MKAAPTLADAALRETFRPHSGVAAAARGPLTAARRFVLDDGMSAFLADISFAAFIAKPNKMIAIAEDIRRSARLPHAVTWIEFNARARRRRIIEQKYGSMVSPEEIPERMGWLLETHPQDDTTFRYTEFNEFDKGTMATPVSYAWSSDDKAPAWLTDIDLSPEEIRATGVCGTGIKGYDTPYVTMMCGPHTGFQNASREMLRLLLKETYGGLRACWALLSVINDIPTTATGMFADTGFFARGKYRKFLDHRVVHLKVPGSVNLRRMAARIVIGARRKRHEVRGHWRKDHWHPGERFWIPEHERGDASLGFVTHEYSVEHNEEVT